MSTQSTLIDWVSCTWQALPARWPWFDDGSAVPCTALYHYNLGWKDRYGCMAFMGGHNAGLHMQWSGEALGNWRDAGIEGQQFIAALVELNAKFTRLDIAVDLKRSRLSVNSLISHAERKIAALKVRSWEMRESDNGGLTIYLGSRASLRFCRAYNKRAELAAKMPVSDDEWIRIEVQLKDDYASGSAIALVEYGIEALLAAHLAQIGDFPRLKAWQRMIDKLGAPCPTIKSQRAPTDTRKWLVEAVAPTLAKELADPTFRDLFSSLVDEYLSTAQTSQVPPAN